jgi:hypothetical protein
MVDGYQVKAYYSERLKACVIPSSPMRRSVTVSSPIVKGTGRALLGIGEGRTQTTLNSKCFSGVYSWKSAAMPIRVSVSATALGYVIPIFNWTVNGQAYVSGSGTQTITVESNPNLDPRHLITHVDPVSVALAVSGGGNSIAIDLPASALGVSLDIGCTVSEWNVPDGYGLTRQDEAWADAAGTVIIMDRRFQDDFAKCVQDAKNFARLFYKEQVVPNIDHGDPPPPWVERQLVAVSTELKNERSEAEFLAHFVERLDPELSKRLSGLARGMSGVIELPRLAGEYHGATVSEPA